MCSLYPAPPMAERRQTGRCLRLAPPDCMRLPPAGPRQAYCPLWGRIPAIFALSAPLQLCPDGFPVQLGKSLLVGLLAQESEAVRNRSGFNRFYWLGKAVIPVAETGAVQPTDDLLDRIVKVIGGSQHIGHISRLCPVLGGVGQAQNAPSKSAPHPPDWFCWQGKPEYRRTDSPILLSAHLP